MKILNSTQIPNDLIQLICQGELSFIEIKIVLAICRQTIGWNKETDWITFSRFRKLTNLSDSLLSRGIQRLVEKGIIEVEGKKERTYSLKLEAERSLKVNPTCTNSEVTPDISISTKETNTNSDASKEDVEVKVSESWKANQKYIADHLEKWQSSEYNWPTSDGYHDWKYVLDHGKRLSPDKLFIAFYWRKKSEMSNGSFTYRYKEKEMAANVMMQEKKNAKLLASMMTLKEFNDRMERVDEKAYDKKINAYKFDWKLSTILKNLANE